MHFDVIIFVFMLICTLDVTDNRNIFTSQKLKLEGYFFIIIIYNILFKRIFHYTMQHKIYNLPRRQLILYGPV